FAYCTSLTSVVIGNGVTSIGESVFYGCTNLTNIKVDENNRHFQSIDGNLYSKDGKALIQYAIGKTDASFIIPDSVTSIGNYAFYGCSKLISVVIGNGVTSIGESAFEDCRSLTSIVFTDAANWYRTANYYDWENKTGGTIVDVTDASQNARNFTSTYKIYYWYKK
ncbi:MAG: leucine-rich repeat domain-containing protein, partial [Clostridia bacterium]|nr:leucine-rich repeat domain-containing protein [Clostridia bacterium]